MHDIVAFLKAAVKRGPTIGTSDCYISDGATMRAYNDTLHAGIDWASNVEFILPADAVDAFLSRCEEISNIEVKETTIILKAGKLRSTISRRDAEPTPPPVLPDEWFDVPKGFIEAIKIAQKFTDENSGRIWQTGVRLWNERVTSCSGKVVIDINLPGLELEKPKLLGKSALAFLIGQDCPDQYGVDRNTISFKWNDGRWVRCQVLNDELPEEIIQRLFSERLGTEAPIAIDNAWIAAHADAAALGDNSIGLSIVGLTAIKENIKSEIALEVDVPTDHASWWETKGLGIMISVADAWNPLNYPEPALFVGPTFKGAIVGVQR